MEINPGQDSLPPQAELPSEDLSDRKRAVVLVVASIIFLMLLYLLLRPTPGAEGTNAAEGTGTGESFATSAGGGNDQGGGGGGGGAVTSPGGQAKSLAKVDTNAVVFFNPFPPAQGGAKPGAANLPPGGSAQGGTSKGGAPVFMGTEGKGSKFVFIIDKSGSMQLPFRGHTRFSTACGHLVQFISGLTPNQEFQVIFYDDQHHPMPPINRLIVGNPSNKNLAIQWIQTQQSGGGTSPHASLQAALAMKPDTVWLLADGQFNNEAALMNTIRNSGGNVMINTIAIASLPGGIMNQIAAFTGGKCKMIN